MAHWFFDAGHGGTDSGAVGKKGTYEKSITLRAVLKAKAIMEANGEKVTLSRQTDIFVSLADRTALANKLGCDYLVSFHMNSASTNAIGTEVWTSVGCSNESTKLANTMLNELVNGIKEMGYETPNRGVKRKNFWMVYRSDMPAILIEGDFINNTLVEDKFNAEKYGEIVANGCLKYIGKKPNNEVIDIPIIEEKPSYTVATIEQSKRFIGNRATDIQKKLIYLGYDLGSWGANGIWGEYSYNALLKFQRDNGLNPDGYCGNNTTAKLNEKYNKKIEDNKPNQVTNYTVKIATDVLNVREGVGTNYKRVAKVYKGEVYTIVEERNGWGKLKSGIGWISLEYTSKTGGFNTTTPQNKIKYGVVTATAGLRVRENSNTSSRILGTLKYNETVKIGFTQGNWHNIYYGNNGGWVSADYIRIK